MSMSKNDDALGWNDIHPVIVSDDEDDGKGWNDIHPVIVHNDDAWYK